MRAVYKYKLQLTNDEQSIITFEKSKILHIAMHAGYPCIWMEVNVNKGVEADVLEFMVLPDGTAIPDNFFYVGTAIDDIRTWHVYKRDKNY